MATGDQAEDEFLVVLRDQADDAALDALQARYDVRHRASPRVVVLRAAPEQVDALQAHPAVLHLTAHALPEAVLASLDEAERLFAAAWSSRRGDAKRRQGDGLPWDAPGHMPPDPPAT